MSLAVEEKRTGSGQPLTRAMIATMLMQNFERLPDIDRKMFSYGPLYLAGNAGLAGLISNSLYRRALNIKQAPLASSLPMAVLPFLTTYTLYTAFVAEALLAGDLNCPTCALMRGAAVGVVGGGLYPILLALPLNLAVSVRYSTALMPVKGAMLNFSLELSKPILRRMGAVLVLQGFFGTYLASKNLSSYEKLAKITFGVDPEELTE